MLADSASSGDVDWTLADSLSDFSFPWEAPPPPRTEFRALWTGDKLLFRFDCVDDDLVLGSGSDSAERVLGSDRVEIFLAPDLTLTPSYGFEMEPRGEVLADQGRYYRQFDWNWSCHGFEFTGHISPPGYIVTGSIPLDALRAMDVLKPGAREFHAGVYRAEFSHRPDGSVHQGWMPWVNPRTAKPDFHVPESFGVFELA